MQCNSGRETRSVHAQWNSINTTLCDWTVSLFTVYVDRDTFPCKIPGLPILNVVFGRLRRNPNAVTLGDCPIHICNAKAWLHMCIHVFHICNTIHIGVFTCVCVYTDNFTNRNQDCMLGKWTVSAINCKCKHNLNARRDVLNSDICNVRLHKVYIER